jgi:CelD/BcsL family acetyltransferase involved in cellulose biosynthesis
MRWGNDSTVICGDSSKEFHKELAIEMAKQNKFTIFFSTLNGKRIAAHTCFDINNRREFYLPGRNPKHEKLRAGSLLLMETILDAIDSGFEIYDFGVVGFDYKMDFTKLTYTTRNFLIYKDYDQPDIDMIYSGLEHRVTVN